ncbi:hypothetical protein OEB99_15820 [Actinotalea sp. M2MS4P-6]|uniref:hypothetical protein n=1 Tax=Actinotalea sp. M2MS4P-6 TaxID=2983762 RepID=UPI0021E4305A|nr:hypothetical protein [Actinotalea sp. M2MS4P-6]MCV2395784.1 hypothetical protein [Actinotalea sp. M2MS4P-6]
MGKDTGGLVVTALAALWIVYLVPQLLRHRQQLAEARLDDRFSEHLRVLRVADPDLPSGAHAPSHGRVQLHPRGGERTMYRPQSVGDRVSADAAHLTAAEHAARAAALTRRAAAARRRAALALTLLMLTAGAWVGAALGSVSVALAVAPTALLTAVLVAGRRAVLAGQRADVAWAEGAARRAARPRPHVPGRPVAVGRAVHPSEAITEVMAKVPTGPVRATASRVLATGEVPVVGEVPMVGEPDRVSSDPRPARPAASADEDDPAVWVPVPVPPPAYTLKPEARRPEPRPLTGQQPVATGVAATEDGHGGEEPERRPTTGGMELDAILARRRASGE